MHLTINYHPHGETWHGAVTYRGATVAVTAPTRRRAIAAALAAAARTWYPHEASMASYRDGYRAGRAATGTAIIFRRTPYTVGYKHGRGK